jgi:hypothetical protein
MVNKSTNINILNNHLSLQITMNIEKTTTHDVGYPGPGFGDRYKNDAGLNQLMRSQTLPFLIIDS